MAQHSAVILAFVLFALLSCFRANADYTIHYEYFSNADCTGNPAASYTLASPYCTSGGKGECVGSTYQVYQCSDSTCSSCTLSNSIASGTCYANQKFTCSVTIPNQPHIADPPQSQNDRQIYFAPLSNAPVYGAVQVDVYSPGYSCTANMTDSFQQPLPSCVSNGLGFYTKGSCSANGYTESYCSDSSCTSCSVYGTYSNGQCSSDKTYQCINTGSNSASAVVLSAFLALPIVAAMAF